MAAATTSALTWASCSDLCTVSEARVLSLAAASRSPTVGVWPTASSPCAVTAIINSHGGVVNQMVDDGLMAIFGAPLALADSCGSAVLAALEISESIALFNADRQVEGKAPLKVGIATGDVVTGYNGTQRPATYTCIGDTVNLAARLEAYSNEAQRMILINDATCAALGGRMPVTPLGPCT